MMSRRLLYILFFFSGFSALVYEITWLRKLSLIFGTDTYAVATIVSVFFIGLGIGSWLFGRIVDSMSRMGTNSKRMKTNDGIRSNSLKIRLYSDPLFLYGLLELGIGVYAAATPWIFKGIEAVQVSFWRGFEPSFGGFSAAAFFLSVVGLIVPTALMGGTLPVISKAFMRINTNEKEQMDANRKVGSSVGSLYAVNTAGAVLGVFAAGFFLMAKLGVNQTIWLAAGVSLLVGVIAVWLSRTRILTNGKRIRTNSISSNSFERASERISLDSRLILAAFAASGFAAIALEVLWTRLLVMVIGGSTYAFSLVLVAFLVGIAVGSAVISRFSDRLRNTLIWFAIIETVLGISVILLIPVFGNLPFWFLSIYESFGQSFPGLQFGLWLMATAVMLIPTLLMGVAFPIVIEAYRALTRMSTNVKRMSTNERVGVGENVGAVYAVNTLGGVFGALAAGFLLIPAIGVQKAILVSGLIYLIIGTFIFFLSDVKRKLKFLSAVVLFMLILVEIKQKSWDTYSLTAGFYVDPSAYSGQVQRDILKTLARDEILYEANGISAHVAVRRERDGNINLRINGKADASTGADMENQLLLGHLPLFFHKNPKEVLVVGMGSGITLGSVLSHRVESVDAIEIEPKVVEAARYFLDYSNNALEDARTNIIVTDGRYFLKASDKKYDVISSEPSNPWLTGSSKLFTKEYYQLLRGAVRENGVVLHWINLYSLDIEGLKSVLAAFSHVFPNVVVFGMPASNDLAMIGANKPLEFDLQQLASVFEDEQVSSDLSKVKIDKPFEILSYFVLDDSTVEKIVGETLPNTDNKPYVEFAAPKYLYAPLPTNPWRIIYENLSPINAIVGASLINVDKELIVAENFRKSRLLMQVYSIERNIGEGIKEGEKALEIDPENLYLSETLARLYFEEGASFLNQGDYAKSISSFKRSIELKETPETYVNLGLSYQGQKDLNKAKEAYHGAIELDNEFEIAYRELGQVLAELGDLNGAIAAYSKEIALNPESTATLVNLGNLYILRKDFGRAEEYLERALILDSTLVEAKELLQAIPK